ncbi:MAG: methyltransferase domain-containing protein [Actinomycetes bacterium]
MRWDPQQYARFAADRGRPFHELVAAVVDGRRLASGAELGGVTGSSGRWDAAPVRRAVDLGCGRGELTVSLLERWPAAHVVGVDSSAEMLADAAQQPLPVEAERLGGGVTWVQADVRDWAPDEQVVGGVDVVISNALLQWVPDHLPLLERFVSWLAPGGTLALQVPHNFDAASHQLLGRLRRSERWRDRLGSVDERSVPTPSDYLAALHCVPVRAGQRLDVRVWETTYHQTLAGDNAVLEWMKGTGLRPVLGALQRDDPSGAAAAEFEAEYGALLAEAYPREPWGTVLPFQRLFVLAQLVDEPLGPDAARPESSLGVPVEPLVAELHHVQLAAPPGSEPVLREFYSGVLGLPEIAKPAVLAARGGAWFRSGALELHLGVEEDFQPARKAHPGLRLPDVAALQAVAERLEAAGYAVTWDDGFPGHRRLYTADPHGNRLELMAPM